MIYYKREGRRDSNFVIYITVWNVYHLNMYHVLDMNTYPLSIIFTRLKFHLLLIDIW